MSYFTNLPRNYLHSITPEASRLIDLKDIMKRGKYFQWSDDPDLCVYLTDRNKSNTSIDEFARQICYDNCLDYDKANMIESILYDILMLNNHSYFDTNPLVTRIESLPGPLATKLLKMIPKLEVSWN